MKQLSDHALQVGAKLRLLGECESTRRAPSSNNVGRQLPARRALFDMLVAKGWSGRLDGLRLIASKRALPRLNHRDHATAIKATAAALTPPMPTVARYELA